ncbi:MAG: exodeoxyribonuclease VII large subunit [Rhodobacteraceae bacterium]|nr:exodeoxyribonuclease VII large subunit [Paracoccaceae bacterium]
MASLTDTETGPGNAPEFTVSDLAGAIRRTLEGAFGRVRVRGEVGRVTRPRSGHLYYDLKDDRNVINCTTWKGQVAGLGMEPEEGLEVIVTGRVGTYGPHSRYTLNVETMEAAGQGALMALLDKRRRALAAEGLFSAERKCPLPLLPEVIGVVTSPSGAVIRDILHRLRDRFPRRVLIWPVAVQGERCAPEVALAIKGFNALPPGGPLPRPDVLIVARGGGALEDLWGFNDERIVRATANSAIPLISAIGHETDTTLIDHAADVRAPTPTAAAELAVPVRLDLLGRVQTHGAHLAHRVVQAIGWRRQRLADLGRSLPRIEALLDTPRQRLDRAVVQLGPAVRHSMQLRRADAVRGAFRLGPAWAAGRAARHSRLARLGAGLTPGRLLSGLRDQRRQLMAETRGLTPGHLAHRVRLARQRLAEVKGRFARASATLFERQRARLDALERLRQTLGYTRTLRRGYAVLRGEQGGLVTLAETARGAGRLEIEFADGRVDVVPAGAAPGGPRPRKSGTSGGAGPPLAQGRLFRDD